MNEAAPPQPPGPAFEAPPWEEMERFGPLPAFFLTVQAVLTRPARTFRRMPPTGRLGRVLLFAVIAGTLSRLFSLAWRGPMESVLSQMQMDEFILPVEGWEMIALTPILVCFEILIVGGLLHLGLSLTGGASRTAVATLKATGYAHTASLATLVPGCGTLLALLGSLALMWIALREVHRTSNWKAAAALALPILLCCGALGWLTLLGAWSEV